jgi:hypothetical protein
MSILILAASAGLANSGNSMLVSVQTPRTENTG